MSGSTIGLGMQVGGQLSGGLAQAGQLRQSAAVDDANAQRTLYQGAIEEQALRSRERATSGEALATEGGSGLSVGTGSAFDLLYQNALERERAVLNTRFSAATSANSLEIAAAQKRSAATSTVVSSLIGAGTSAIFGEQNIQDQATYRAAGAAYRTRTVPGGFTMQVPQNNAPAWNTPVPSFSTSLPTFNLGAGG